MLASIPLHPPLAQLPIGIAVITPMLSLGIAFAISRTWLPRGAWLIAVCLCALGAGTGLMAREAGEDEAERLNDPSLQAPLARHVEAANGFTATSVALMLLSAAVFFVRNERAFNAATLVVAVLTFASMGFALQTGRFGGELVFTYAAGQPPR